MKTALILAFAASILLGAFLWLRGDEPEDSEGTDDPQAPEPSQPSDFTSPVKIDGGAWIKSMQKYKGAKYSWGGQGEEGREGFDCSGLGWKAAKDIGVSIPRLAGQMRNVAKNMSEDDAKAKAGAMIFFYNKDRVLKHVEYSEGTGRSVMAAQTSGGVKSYSWGWWNGKKKNGDPTWQGAVNFGAFDD